MLNLFCRRIHYILKQCNTSIFLHPKKWIASGYIHKCSHPLQGTAIFPSLLLELCVSEPLLMLLAVVVSDPLPVLDVAVVSDPLPVFVLTDEHLRRDVSDGGDLTLKNGGERRGVERIDPVGERIDPVGE